MERDIRNGIIIAVGATIGVGTVTLCARTLRNFSERRQLTKLRHRKQKERREQFENLRRRYKFGPQEEEIISINFERLVEKLQKRELKATQVLEAYLAKALEVTDEFNCVTEFVPHCFEYAEELDSLPEVKGPLHGVPFCVKDDHSVEGMDSTLGCSRYLYKPAAESAVVVKVLQDAGAIPFCKTNLPQTTFSAGSENPIFGLTLNPLNKKLTPGGSSSGTGCLVGAGGAPFGIGSDIGGSIRKPASFCGISGLKPTISRNSIKGVRGCFSGNAGFSCVSGILAPTAAVVAKIQEILWTDSVQNKYDPSVVPISWDVNSFSSKRPLKIGYLTSIPLTPAVGDMPEVVLNAVRKLKADGHEVIEFELPSAARIMQVYVSILLADGLTQINKLLKNDTVADIIKGLTALNGLPTFLRNFIVRITNKLENERMKSHAADPSTQESKILWDYLTEAQSLRENLFTLWKKENLDVLLTPACPTAPPLLEDMNEVAFYSTLYLADWNALDFPAGVVPFGKESGTNLDELKGANDPYLKLASKTIVAAEGMPLAVQVIGLPFREEKVLRVMKLLEELR